ncbi:hypothetical protein ETB97_000235 [Aspergillus alliaceus]|uniref:U4/U6.U5 small nuclear ribonucleoprotein 27kDa protein domain-containing protein n=1 Tax=Petromyces alliaceus TaxID=209559 RepID=A0A5N6G922_PETAA|nr:uncharacterized protein BDW43DRAFT_264040 [Aspergillus alliaceus]KAB8237724.1 hypothetical protein BDW43DRAFT_264040 [Aspergillus alliaceus]KAE8388226.1 hypothetical protein BDV23DRAFT_159588 [Aspergillus alliaceus]KAF5866271.1 hypothetical protein ETB97_000235 [Aspergillus burnettii]
MAEPPAKRARRADSSAMWDMDDRRTRSPEQDSEYNRSPRREAHLKDDGRRDGPRDDRRYRSRSRDRRDRRRDRSRSRDRRDRDRGHNRRDLERSSSRDKYYDKRGYPSKGERNRDRSRSPLRNGNRDRSRTPPLRGPRGDRRNDRKDPRIQANGATEPRTSNRSKDEMDMDIDAGEDDIDEMIRRSMGFSRFRSTKNTKVPGNDIYGVRKEKKTEYRQYMNRQGGFNRPLSPSR